MHADPNLRFGHAWEFGECGEGVANSYRGERAAQRMVFGGRGRPKDGHKAVALDSGYDSSEFSDAAEHELNDPVQISTGLLRPKGQYSPGGLNHISKDNCHSAKFGCGIGLLQRSTEASPSLDQG